MKVNVAVILIIIIIITTLIILVNVNNNKLVVRFGFRVLKTQPAFSEHRVLEHTPRVKTQPCVLDGPRFAEHAFYNS